MSNSHGALAQGTHVRRRVACPLPRCPQTLSRSADIKRHLMEVHNMSLNGSPLIVPKILCEVNGCTEEYKNVGNRNTHMCDKHNICKRKRCAKHPKQLPTNNTAKGGTLTDPVASNAALKKRKRSSDDSQDVLATQASQRPNPTTSPAKRRRTSKFAFVPANVQNGPDESSHCIGTLSKAGPSTLPAPSFPAPSPYVPVSFEPTQAEPTICAPTDNFHDPSLFNWAHCYPNLTSYPSSYPTTSRSSGIPSSNRLASRMQRNPIIPASVLAQSMGTAYVEPISSTTRFRGRRVMQDPAPNTSHDEVGCHRSDAYNQNARYAPYAPTRQSLSQYAFAQPVGMYSTGNSYHHSGAPGLQMSSYVPQSYSPFSDTPVYSSAAASSSSGSYPSSHNPTAKPQTSSYDTHIPSSSLSSYPSYPNPSSTSQPSIYDNSVLPSEDPQYDYNLDYTHQATAQPVVQPVPAYKGHANLPRLPPFAVIPAHNLPVPLRYTSPDTSSSAFNDNNAFPLLSPILPGLSSSPKRTVESLLPELEPLQSVVSTPTLESNTTPQCLSNPASVAGPPMTSALDDFFDRSHNGCAEEEIPNYFSGVDLDAPALEWATWDPSTADYFDYGLGL
ncbi:hypothetical protein BDN70DRAFT_898748 [Pholiota conissans]|uniref:C2H2-type domain-containing protein n=1 Tax=Pholiota conissans TaxID=109636 RepID=A0A9P6CQ62_9AGAR|nr:hypothetical protein BDN70DRAFT_898748 [Pholiota conissans]